MLKVTLLLTVFVAFASARPGYLHGHGHHHFDYPLIHHHEPVHVAKIIHVPAAISHQSSTIIHSPAHHIVKPIVVPVVKSIVHPVYHPAPIIKAYHPAPLHLDPFHHHFDHHHFDHHAHFDHHDLHHFH